MIYSFQSPLVELNMDFIEQIPEELHNLFFIGFKLPSMIDYTMFTCTISPIYIINDEDKLNARGILNVGKKFQVPIDALERFNSYT